MRTEQKAFLLGLVLFIGEHFIMAYFVVSALLQSLYEILEPQILALAANRSTNRGQHMRSVFLAIIVLVASLCASIAVTRFLPIDLWCLIIGSNCLLTALHTLSALIVYAIYRLETESMDAWGQADYVVFLCKTITCGVEVLLALNVVCFGHWTLTSLAVLVFYMYFSVWRRLQAGIVRVQSRRAAYSSLSRLPRVSKEALQQRRDACAICLSDILEDARITPCNHFFHSECLKKWLCVKQVHDLSLIKKIDIGSNMPVCPLCYSDLCKCKIPEALEQLFLEERHNFNAPEEIEDGNSESFGTENPSEDEYFPWDVLSGSPKSFKMRCNIRMLLLEAKIVGQRAYRSICGEERKIKLARHIQNFREVYPDFQPSSIHGRRNLLREELERKDMLERRLRIDIPEFYVGSIVAVTYSDKKLIGLRNRFLGICINRRLEGLKSQFTLRNVIEGIGVEVMYEMYTPTITKIEVIKLEKRLDDDLSYLIDAYPEYSTFDIHMEPTSHVVGKPIPINPLKITNLRKYDLIADYRQIMTDIDEELLIEQEMLDFEIQRQQTGATKRKILRSAEQPYIHDL
ncbi:unnamed protein product [Brugia timori]|uniref:Large ribosomal subunit protein bL19m n=1 Tax=Brugia timori TaxID=42155 RepID=A0A0R3QRV2_9BILA|nr:unnamed protein product [Brugia timori]